MQDSDSKLQNNSENDDSGINFWFDNELENIKAEYSEAKRQVESYSTMGFIRLYGLPIFMASTFFTLLALITGSGVNMDYFTIACTISATFLIVSLWINKYNLIEGPNGQINYLAERTILIEMAKNKGNSIGEFDIKSKKNWLKKYVIEEGTKMPADHPFHKLDKNLKYKAIVYTGCTVIAFIIALINFLANLSLQLDASMEKMAVALGWGFKLIPEWGQWLHFSYPAVVLPFILILMTATITFIGIFSGYLENQKSENKSV